MSSATSDDAKCAVVDRIIEPAVNPARDLRGEALAQELNVIAKSYGEVVEVVFDAPAQYWVVVDRGRRDIVPEIEQRVRDVRAQAPVTLRLSCTSHQDLGAIQRVISEEFGDDPGVQISTDLDVLNGRVVVTASTEEVANAIRQKFGDLVEVAVAVTSPASNPRLAPK